LLKRAREREEANEEPRAPADAVPAAMVTRVPESGCGMSSGAASQATTRAATPVSAADVPKRVESWTSDTLDAMLEELLEGTA
jgi:hypothetical protein